MNPNILNQNILNLGSPKYIGTRSPIDRNNINAIKFTFSLTFYYFTILSMSSPPISAYIIHNIYRGNCYIESIHSIKLPSGEEDTPDTKLYIKNKSPLKGYYT